MIVIKFVHFTAPGSIGPFGLLSDKEHVVKYFVDQNTFSKFDYFAFPFVSSSKTIVVHKEDFVNFFQSSSSYIHKIRLVKFNEDTNKLNV